MKKGKKFKGRVKIRQDLFAYLPPEIIIDILSRLPVRSILRCKCVCKSWVDLLKTPEFVKSHLSKSVPGIISYESYSHSKLHKIVEFVDEPDLNCRWNLVFELDLPFLYHLHSSVNGLLCMWQMGTVSFVVCNPITREYIQLPPHTESFHKPGGSSGPALITFGFGVSRVSGQYKVVRMLLDFTTASKSLDSECLVYTVGTGSWRRISSSRGRIYQNNDVGSFLNGNLHWFTTDLNGKDMISCFDLETERFSMFSAPFDECEGHVRMSPLGDCLCLCHTSFHGGHDTSLDIWLMKEYGNAESWTKQIHIGRSRDFNINGLLCPMVFFKNGDMLMDKMGLLYYSSKTKTVRQVDATGLDTEGIFPAVFYTPSFVPLGTYAMEYVLSF